MATGPYRMLVVDDEPAVCALVQDERRQQGYHCTAATQPERAIGLLDGDAFDLILADIPMPRLSGTRFDPTTATAALAWCPSHRQTLFPPE